MFRAILLLFCAGALLSEEQPAKPAPELKVTLVDGRDFAISKQRGKVVALEMVYTTCPHCQQTSQVIDKLYREYGRRGFQPIAVACNEGAELLVGEFARELQLSFPVGIGYPALIFEYLAIPPQKIHLPVLLLIDRKGLVRARYTGEDPLFTDAEANLRKTIEPLLNEPAPAANTAGKRP